MKHGCYAPPEKGWGGWNNYYNDEYQYYRKN